MKQTDRLELYLKANRSIDPITAWHELGIYRLAARVADLKKAGHIIHSATKPVLNRYGEKCKVASYSMSHV